MAVSTIGRFMPESTAVLSACNIDSAMLKGISRAGHSLSGAFSARFLSLYNEPGERTQEAEL